MDTAGTAINCSARDGLPDTLPDRDESSGHRRRRLHRVATSSAPLLGRRRCRASTGAADHRAGQAHLRRQLRQPRPGRRDERLAALRAAATSATRALVDAARAAARRGRALRRRVARRPVDPRGAAEFAATNVVGTQCCSTPRCGTARPLRARLHRRGLRLDRPPAPWTERAAGRARTRRTRPPRPARDLLALAYHRTHGLDGRGDPLRQQLRAVPVSRRSSIPRFVTNLLDGPHGAAATATASRSATGCTWTTTAAGVALALRRRARRARSTTSAAAPN